MAMYTREFELLWEKFIKLINEKFSDGKMREDTKQMLKDYWYTKGPRELEKNYLKIKSNSDCEGR
jgi:hypothetical protein